MNMQIEFPNRANLSFENIIANANNKQFCHVGNFLLTSSEKKFVYIMEIFQHESQQWKN